MEARLHSPADVTASIVTPLSPDPVGGSTLSSDPSAICILVEGGIVVGIKASPGLAHIMVSVCDVDNEAEAATQEYETFSGVVVY